MKGARLPDGRGRVVRHGHAPERLVQTGVGTTGSNPQGSARSRCGGPNYATAALARMVSASASPRPSCRAGRGGPGAWTRRCRPSTCAGSRRATSARRLGGLLGKDAPHLSPPMIARLRAEWEAGRVRWQRRDLSAPRYVHVWADGVHLQARMEPQAECMLVLTAPRPRARRNSSASGSACGKARRAGGNCWWTVSAATRPIFRRRA